MAETSSYKAPNNAIKIPDGDTGYGIVKKAYRRFIWTWNDAPKNKDDYKGKMKHLNEWEDQFPGGRADDRTPEEFDQFELDLGKAVEKEHTSEEKGPTEIAMDHLVENPKYYTEGFEKGIFDEDVTDVLVKWKDDERAQKLMKILGIEEDGYDPGYVNLGEVPGMGRSDSDWMPGATVGYRSGPLSNKNMMPSHWYADPDDKNKERREMKNLQHFDNYIH